MIDEGAQVTDHELMLFLDVSVSFLKSNSFNIKYIITGRIVLETSPFPKMVLGHEGASLGSISLLPPPLHQQPISGMSGCQSHLRLL